MKCCIITVASSLDLIAMSCYLNAATPYQPELGLFNSSSPIYYPSPPLVRTGITISIPNPAQLPVPNAQPHLLQLCRIPSSSLLQFRNSNRHLPLYASLLATQRPSHTASSEAAKSDMAFISSAGETTIVASARLG